MAYWMLVVSDQGGCPPLEVIEVPLFSEFEADYDVRRGSDEDWREIELQLLEEDETLSDCATIRREVEPERVAEQVGALLDGLDDAEPPSAAKWLREKLRGARTVYACTPHHPRRRGDALAALRAVSWSIQQATSGLHYAEGEGWSNREGYLITFEFDHEELGGPWWCAVLDEQERWLRFQIDLGSAAQRSAFRGGRVPQGLKAIPI